jgi:hypothetical protein
MNNQPSALEQLNAQNAAAQQQNNVAPGVSMPNVQTSQNPTASMGDITSALGNNQPATVKAPTANDNENWLTRLLPTAGSIIGGIGGALIPGLGETGIGEVGGAGVGSALGKGLEDLLTGKQAGADVLGAGAEGLAGGALGKGAEAAIGAVGKGLAGVGAKGISAADEATQAANTSAQALATKLNYGGISSKIQKDLNLGSNQKVLEGLGYDPTNPFDMQKAAQAGKILDAKYDAALATTKPVDMTGFTKGIYNTLKTSGGTDLTSSPIGKALADFENPGNGELREITGSMNPTDVRDLQQAIGTQIGNTQRIVNNSELLGQTNVQAESDLSALHQMYDELGGKIKTPELDAALSGQSVTPEERQQFITQFGENHGNQLADTIDNSSNADDYLKPMQQYSQMNSASKMATDDILNATGTQSAVQRGKFGSIGSPVTPQQIMQATKGSATVDAEGNPIANVAAATGHPIISAAGKAFNALNPAAGGARSAGAIKLGNLLERIAPKAGLTAGALVGTSPNMGGEANTNTAVGQGGIVQNLPQTNDVASMLSSTNPTVQLLGTDLLRAEHPVLGQSSVLGGAGDLESAGGLNKVNTAQSQLAALVNMLNQAGGAQGPIGGNLAKFSSMFTGGPAANYDQQAQQLVSQINGTLGTNIAAPSITSNQQGANDVLQQLQTALIANGAGY